MATIYEVSKLAGVSLATVSRVMNDSGRVSDKTKEKVLQAMRELDYAPNTFAQSLASNRSNCVGVLVSEMHGPIFGAMLTGIEEELRLAGKFAIFAAGHSDKVKEEEGIRFLASRNCDALILHVEALSNDYFLERRDNMLPFILLNRNAQELQEHCIGMNNEEGGYLATRSLLEFGHRHIGYISGPLHWGDATDRLSGHKRALEEYGVPFDERLLYEGDYTEFAGSRGAKAFLEKGVTMTAVVCANDEMAAGAMDAFHRKGLKVPSNISVVGFDNVRWARFLNPKLSTVDYPINEMSRAAVHRILGKVYSKETRKYKSVFEPRFIQRSSSGPVRGSR